MTLSFNIRRLPLWAAFIFCNLSSLGQSLDSLKCIGLATQLHQQFTSQQFEDSRVLLDSLMNERLTPESLERTWESLASVMGGYEEIIDHRYIDLDTGGIAVLSLKYKRGVLDMRVTCALDDSLIHGLFIVPGKKKFVYKVPDYADTTAFTEQEISITSNQVRLPGTLTLPVQRGPHPLVVLVHGSGPSDRDESIGPNKPFKDLAWGLASQGIAVLRYDKVTKVYPEKFSKGLTVMEETVYDARAAVELAQSIESIDTSRIFVLGHSLGGMLAPRIITSQQHIAGIIIMAGNTRPLEDLILEQTHYILNLDKLSDNDLNQLDALKEQIDIIKSKDLIHSPDSVKPLGVSASYWLDLRKYNPVKTARKLKLPIFVMQGERDYQVTMKDYKMWGKALSNKKTAQLKSYPKLNHLMMEGYGMSKPSEYELAGNVANQIIVDIASWIKTTSQ